MIKRAVITALIVGSVLTVINQVDAVFGEAELIIWQALLSTAVPFVVSLVSAYLTLKNRRRRTRRSLLRARTGISRTEPNAKSRETL